MYFFSYLFIEFDRFWLECEPRDIMEFNRIRDIFENNLRNNNSNKIIITNNEIITTTIKL